MPRFLLAVTILRVVFVFLSLTFNALSSCALEPTVGLGSNLAGTQSGTTQTQSGNEVEPQPPTLMMHPFELDRRVHLEGDERDNSKIQVEAFRFIPRVRGERFREIWAHSTLRAEIDLTSGKIEPALEDELLLVLYDAEGSPLTTSQVPLASLPIADRPATRLLSKVQASNEIWLSPDVRRLPRVEYKFHSPAVPPNSGVEHCSIRNNKNKHYQRGVTMTLGLNAFVKKPAAYNAPVLFEGMLNQKEVTVAAITGPQFGWVFGYGIIHSWQGYVVSVDSQCLLVVEKATGRPIVSRYRDTEVYFLDYVEVQPGQYAPLRIAVRHDNEWEYDFRFQIVNERVWLFDGGFRPNGNRVVYIDGITVDGALPADLKQRGETTPIGELEPFDWAAITDRRILRDADNPLVKEIVSHEAPFRHPRFEALGGTATISDRRISMDWLIRDTRECTVLVAEPTRAGRPRNVRCGNVVTGGCCGRRTASHL